MKARMKKPQVSVSVDPDVFLRLKEFAEADERSLAQVGEQAIKNGIDFVEKRLREAGRWPIKKKPPVKSVSTIIPSSELTRMAV